MEENLELTPEQIEAIKNNPFMPRNRAERRAMYKKNKKILNQSFNDMAEEKRQEFYKLLYEKVKRINEEERGNENEGTNEGN